jgi:probable addiction module antidote protein
MNTVFVGGSRHVSRLSPLTQERLSNVIQMDARVIVGDANGADKAVQRFLSDHAYPHVTVFCSGEICRNNVGQWHTRHIDAPKNAKGFDFYAAKDRVMAHEADFGLMIWDGKSAGTILNILRLIHAGRKAVLINVPEKTTTNFKTPADWKHFLASCTSSFRDDVHKRAMPDEWISLEPPQQPNFLDPIEAQHHSIRHPQNLPVDEGLAADINAAFATGDSTFIIETLGNFARARGMSHVAKDAGLARESLYRSLGAGGNPEFTTVLKVLSSMGLRLVVRRNAGSKRDK